MSTFDIRTDAPGLLRTESMNITIVFNRTGPTTGRISWNIPSPAAGCAAGTQAYAGMVVTLDTTPTTITRVPVNGTSYTGDPTATANLFAGDKIGTALVVGAYYDKTTTIIDITGLQPNTPCYVTGFPVDAQYRYYVEGVHAYSTEFRNKGTSDTHGSQVVVLNPEQQVMGVQPTDSTGLNTTLTYDLNVQVGLIPKPASPLRSTDCALVAPTYNLMINGAVSQTYQQLVVEINKRLALATNSVQGPTPPNAGTYYWNTAQQQLFLWDGSVHTLVQPTVVQPTDPSSVVIGTHWYNPTTDSLAVWSGVTWTPVSVIKFDTDPSTPQADQTYWYDTVSLTGYLWNGVAWCEKLTYNQATDPSIPTDPPAGSYWFNTATTSTYRWNEALGIWTSVIAVEYLRDPNTLAPLDYWFNTTTNTLYEYGTPVALSWNLQTNVSITEIAPATPAVGKFWYNPISQVLQQWNGTVWNTLDVITLNVDPTVRTSCGLWWNTSLSVLNVWDTINSAWVTSSLTYVQSTDPTNSPTIAEGTLWYNTVLNTLSVWENTCFIPVPFVAWASNPITVVDGVSWLNTTTNVWYIRQAGAWVIITPSSSSQALDSLATGTFWFNTTLPSSLQQWNGLGWTAVTYTTSPLTPTTGTQWFNTSTSTLMMWDGSAWVVGTQVATCELDCNGNLLFTDSAVGGLSFILVSDGTLLQSLANLFAIHDTNPGTDGASDEISYQELGIGTDGSVEERLALHTEIRYELGYPVIEVEVTPEQINYAIDKSLTEFRSRSSLAYKRGFFFMTIPAETQRFVLTSKISGMNKIVDIMGVYRLTSSFLSSAHGAGVYGQIVLQHMYNMGTFDLLSYHIMGEYTKLMEILFAARVTYTWNEQSRILSLHNRFTHNERQVAIEATTERTEQDLLTDRYTRGWLRRYSLATVRIILAETRGKFGSMPSAGGSITLNASDLRQAANAEIEACLMEIDQYIADRPEEYGKFDFTFG